MGKIAGVATVFTAAPLFLQAEQIIELGLFSAGLGVRLVEVSLGITKVDFPNSLGEFIQALISQ